MCSVTMPFSLQHASRTGMNLSLAFLKPWVRVLVLCFDLGKSVSYLVSRQANIFSKVKLTACVPCKLLGIHCLVNQPSIEFRVLLSWISFCIFSSHRFGKTFRISWVPPLCVMLLMPFLESSFVIPYFYQYTVNKLCIHYSSLISAL